MFRYRQFEHRALLSLALFSAGSALGGGIAMLVGGIEFPLEWLDGSMFANYTVPAIVLAANVGGSQMIAAAAMIRREPWRLETVVVAGVIMMGWIVVEIAIVGSESGLMRTLQIIYFVLGLAEAVLAGFGLPRRATAA